MARRRNAPTATGLLRQKRRAIITRPRRWNQRCTCWNDDIPLMDSVLNYLKDPEWRRQHFWRKAVWRTMSRLGLNGLHALPLNRRWVEIHRRKMPLKGLDPSLSGLKIVQISDLHYSPVVWERYLLQFVRWVNDAEPDIVVV